MGNDIGGKIKGAVFALVAGIVILHLVPVTFEAADNLHSRFYPHCQVAGKDTSLISITGGSNNNVPLPDGVIGRVYRLKDGGNGNCAIPAQTTTLGAWSGATAASVLVGRTDSDIDLWWFRGGQARSSVPGGQVTWLEQQFGRDVWYTETVIAPAGKWILPGEVMRRFQGINRLVTSILPVLITVGLFAVVGFGAAKMWRTGDMGQSIAVEVGVVITVVVVMNLAPSMFDAIVEGASANAGQYGVTAQFSGIIDLLFGLLPLLVVLSLIGLIAWRGYAGYKSMRGPMRM